MGASLDGRWAGWRSPAVLLQRFRGTVDDWDPDFIAAISCGRRVIRFDSAGIGRSGGSVPDSIFGNAAIATAR